MLVREDSPEVGLPNGSPPIKAALKVSPDLCSFHNSPCCLNGSFSVLAHHTWVCRTIQPHSTSSGCGFYHPCSPAQNREHYSIQPVPGLRPGARYDYLLNRLHPVRAVPALSPALPTHRPCLSIKCSYPFGRSVARGGKEKIVHRLKWKQSGLTLITDKKGTPIPHFVACQCLAKTDV